jgi:hypothetical protein
MTTTSMAAVVCEFCGVANEAVAPPGMPVTPVTAQPVSSNITLVAVVFLVTLGVAMSGAIVSAVARSQQHHEPPPAVAITIPPIPPLPVVLSPAEPIPHLPLTALHTTVIDWIHPIPIDGTAMVGSLDHFDALANWDWAVSVGQAWWYDAELYELHVEPIEKDGTANLTADGAAAEYRLVSKSCKKDREKRAETEKPDQSSCSLVVAVAHDGASVKTELIDAAGRARAITKPSCSISQVFDSLETSKRLTPRPVYGIRLEHDVSGFSYVISAGRDVASMTNIHTSASSCGKTAVGQR